MKMRYLSLIMVLMCTVLLNSPVSANDGASGMMSFNATGDPDKCVVIVRVDADVLTAYQSVCP